jgi:hypothetical protein
LLGNNNSFCGAGVRNPSRKGDLLGITIHCLQQVQETQSGRGIW